MYAQGKVKHVDPPLAALEDEMADFGLGGLSSGASPDRLDALVWAVTELTRRGTWDGPRIRSTWDGPLVPKRILGRSIAHEGPASSARSLPMQTFS